jgi:hypothetical protein
LLLRSPRTVPPRIALWPDMRLSGQPDTPLQPASNRLSASHLFWPLQCASSISSFTCLCAPRSTKRRSRSRRTFARTAAGPPAPVPPKCMIKFRDSMRKSGPRAPDAAGPADFEGHRPEAVRLLVAENPAPFQVAHARGQLHQGAPATHWGKLPQNRNVSGSRPTAPRQCWPASRVGRPRPTRPPAYVA